MDKCQRCGGTGSIGPVLFDSANDAGYRKSMPCDDCDGTGQWDEAKTERWRIGRAHREKRVARDESLRECAKRYGMTAAQLFDFEHGRTS